MGKEAILSEAGRVLSKANESKLRAAFQEIEAILSLLDGDDSADTKEARKLLQEAANLGNWLEARIHLAFTEIADHMFGDGRLTREERIGLSSAIGSALDAFNAAVAESLPQVYTRSPWADAEPVGAMSEATDINIGARSTALEEPQITVSAGQDILEAAIDGEFIPLVERAVRRDGTIAAKIIAPGWGTSGYYPKEVLERDGPKFFPKGMQMFWDHPTAQEEAERPEGSLNALAAELIEDARFADGPAGPGLYANARVFEAFQRPIDEMAKHIGVSIRASGRAILGKAEGREGPIVQGFTHARGVDFVTKPGAKGQILEMFEAARRPTIVAGEATARRSEITAEAQEENVNETQFNEAVTRLETQNQELQQQNARFREALLLRDAREFVRTELMRETIPDITKARLVEALAANPPVIPAGQAAEGEMDRATFATRIAEAVKAEVEYLTKAAGYGSGRIEGMGGSQAAAPEHKPEEVQAKMSEAFGRLGLSESAAQVAAKGRGF